jgi:hypothetical protein
MTEAKKSITLVTKLSMKTVCNGSPDAPKKDEPPKKLARFYGIATGVKTGESAMGPWTALLGSFRGINFDTGEMFQSGKCFLPNVALNMITPQLLKSENQGVSFAFDISVRRDETSATKYIYTADPIMDAEESDPLEMLTKKINSPALLSHRKESGKG